MKRGLASVLRRLLTISVTDPGHAWDQARKVFHRGGPPIEVHYEPDGDCERTIHGLLNADFPCPDQERFRRLWGDIEAELSAGSELGLGLDADRAFAQALWCIVTHSGATRVVETGVARGISSRVILEAMRRNGSGHLWSIDLPPLRDPWWSEAAAAVPSRLREDWTYVRGDSKRLLPRILRQAGHIDLFVHDSVHDDEYMRFEIEHGAAALRAGGLMVVDDITHSRAYGCLVAARSMGSCTCRHAEKESMFGVVLKR